MVGTGTPPHDDGPMRLTIDLEPDLYAAAVSLAKAEGCSVGAAVNRLIRRALPGAQPGLSSHARHMKRRNGLLVSAGRAAITGETVQRIEAEEDRRLIFRGSAACAQGVP